MVTNLDNRREMKVSVRDLRIGMFVSALDRDWLGTSFLLQGFFIRDESDIEELGKFCSYVYVLGVGKARFDEPVDFESGELIGRKPEKYTIRNPLKKEFVEVRRIVKNARSFVDSMLKDVSNNKSVAVEDARAVVIESVESVIRHPDAAAFVTKLRGQDDYTAEHCMNVCMLAIVFGRKLGLRKQQLINLGLCGLLHDAGKARIPLEILNKPGRLTGQEYEIMRTHTTLGMELLSEKKGMYQEAIEVAYAHHERPDGTGYPRGLPAENITLFTKIISIVDAYDAITGDRVYAKGRPSTEALRIIFETAGEQFDRGLALAFIQTVGIYPPGMLVELVNGMVAIVVDTADTPKHLPIICVVRDHNKKTCKNAFVTLEHTVDGKVDRGYLIRNALPDGCYGVTIREYFNQGVFEYMQDMESD